MKQKKEPAAEKPRKKESRFVQKSNTLL